MYTCVSLHKDFNFFLNICIDSFELYSISTRKCVVEVLHTVSSRVLIFKVVLLRPSNTIRSPTIRAIMSL